MSVCEVYSCNMCVCVHVSTVEYFPFSVRRFAAAFYMASGDRGNVRYVERK